MLLTGSCTLARASTLVALQVNGNCLREVVAEVADIFLGKCLPCDDCKDVSAAHIRMCTLRTLECLLDVDSVLCAGLEVRNAAFRLAERHGTLGGDLGGMLVPADHQGFAKLTILLLSSTSILLPITT